MLNVSNQINVLLTCLNNFNFKTIHFSFSYFYLFIIYPEYLNIWKLANYQPEHQDNYCVFYCSVILVSLIC